MHDYSYTYYERCVNNKRSNWLLELTLKVYIYAKHVKSTITGVIIKMYHFIS